MNNPPRILLGISGGIAAYKVTFLVRALRKAGYEVRVIMTRSAHAFVAPLSLSVLSGNDVVSEMVPDTDAGAWNDHIELGLWPDLFLIAPATAHTLSGLAIGSSADLLQITYLSSRCPVIVAPAMDLDMFAHASVQRNIETLQNDGVVVLPSPAGELASGLEGEGRMLEPEDILFHINTLIRTKGERRLMGKRVLISAGPTYEAIDPVRFIGNHSSGKTGYALAEAAIAMGAHVTLVSGPSSERIPYGLSEFVRVSSAEQMQQAMETRFDDCELCIMSAAVADYRPSEVADKKVKKSEDVWTIALEKNADILQSLGKRKAHQKLVGFALETNDGEANAKGKLEAKNLDAILLNEPGAHTGFGTETNKFTIFTSDNNSVELELSSKQELAVKTLDLLCDNYF